MIKSYISFNFFINSSKIGLLNNSEGLGTLIPDVKTLNSPTKDLSVIF